VGKATKIEWADHTFNPWWGCVRVSDACKNCYAEAWAKRVGQQLWGPRSRRRFFGDAHWAQPARWNAEAARLGVRRRVFCASMADVFEDRAELDPWRERLWATIESTPNLDWLLLTKRPELASARAPWRSAWPGNVWAGATVESARWARLRIPQLEAVPATVRFLSCEPLLGRLDLSPWLEGGALGWVIAGGESGPGARPADPAWVRSLRDACVRAEVAFHFKQWGEWAPASDGASDMVRLGKKRAGRVLDGRTWDEVPAAGGEQHAGRAPARTAGPRVAEGSQTA
jgi:protein gp37